MSYGGSRVFGVDGVMEMISAALGEGPGSAPWAWSDEELQDRVEAIFAHIQRAGAAHLALVREIEGRALPQRQGQSPTQWLHDRHRISPRTAKDMLRLAAELDTDRLAATAKALADGSVNDEQAAAIAEALRGLPAEHRAAGERLLLAEAAQSDRHGLAMRARSLLEELDPEEAERLEQRRADLDAAQAMRDRSLDFYDLPGSQQTKVTAMLPRADAAALREAIDALSSPRRDRCATGDGRPLPLGTPRQLRADALMELVRIALACGDLPDHGGDRPQVTVTMPLRLLREVSTDAAEAGLRATVYGGVLDDGTRLGPAEARRLACDAGVVPAVLDGQSIPLDIGKERRLYGGVLRRALIVRDGGCAFPGCTRPPKWCDGHHIVHWADGGATELDNGVLLCHPHHRMIHFGEWVVRLHPQDRLPEFVPPKYIDPDQLPRRNTFHRIRGRVR